MNRVSGSSSTLRAATFMDCAGLNILIRAHRYMRRRNGNVEVNNGCPQVRLIMRLGPVDRFIAVS